MAALQRWAIQTRGQVQGVGFRPFVYRLAVQHGVSGFVRKDGGGETIEVQGSVPTLEALLGDLHKL